MAREVALDILRIMQSIRLADLTVTPVLIELSTRPLCVGCPGKIGQGIKMYEIVCAVVEIHRVLGLAKVRGPDHREVQWKTRHGEGFLVLQSRGFGTFLFSFFVEYCGGECLIPLAMDGHDALHEVCLGSVERVVIIPIDVVRETEVRV